MKGDLNRPDWDPFTAGMIYKFVADMLVNVSWARVYAVEIIGEGSGKF